MIVLEFCNLLALLSNFYLQSARQLAVSRRNWTKNCVKTVYVKRVLLLNSIRSDNSCVFLSAWDAFERKKFRKWSWYMISLFPSDLCSDVVRSVARIYILTLLPCDVEIPRGALDYRLLHLHYWHTNPIIRYNHVWSSSEDCIDEFQFCLLIVAAHFWHTPNCSILDCVITNILININLG